MNDHVPAFRHLVVIGASAGGLESLSALIAAVPADFLAPIVVALHQSRDRETNLDAILAGRTSLRIQHIHEPARLEAGTIYLVPPDRNVTITDGVVAPEAVGNGPSPSVDLLFQTAAQAFGEDTIAIVLSGTGSDGVVGTREVRSVGGTVLVQNPDSAAFPHLSLSLPVSMVDAEADPAQLAALLVDFVHDGRGVSPISDRSLLREFLEALRDESGIDFTTYRQATILRRVKRRMAATGYASFPEYLQHVDQDMDERQRLINSFLINVTQFFRDQELFDYLRTHILPELIENAHDREEELRIWSAGCSTGEEAYSIAITVSELLDEQGITLPVRVFATDLDEAAVAFARRGIYNERLLAALPQEIVQKYFAQVGDEYEVRKRLRNMLIFGEHDLAQRAPFPRIGLILCRNVLIYFTPALQRRALQLFAFSLQQGGYLVLGKSETVSPLVEYFGTDEPRLKVFRRVGEQVAIPSTRIGNVRSPGPGFPQAPRRQPARSRASRPASRREALSEQTIDFEHLLHGLPLGVVVVDRTYDIQYINTEGRRLFGIHTTAFDQDLIHLLKQFDPFEVRRLIDEAETARQGGPEVLQAIGPTDGVPQSIEVTCVMMRSGAGESRRLVMVTAADVSDREQARRGEAAARELSDRLIKANEEVLTANRDLTITISRLRDDNEQLMIASAEVQAATEEVETLNEELQASNEELETLNEELQATVEELNTTNDDLNARTIELQAMALQGEVARQQLRTILNAIEEAVVVVRSDGTPEFQNRAFTRLLGEGIEDRQFLDAAGAQLSPGLDPLGRVREGKAFAMEASMRRENGELSRFSVRGLLAGPGGGRPTMVLMFRLLD